MNLRQRRRAVQSGEWVIEPTGEVQAKTRFQRERLMAAISLSRVYLAGTMSTEELGRTLRVSAERAAQMVRLGVNYMQREGWLRPAANCPAPPQSAARRS